MAKKSLKGKGSFAAYQTRGTFSTNKKAKLAKHAKLHPNDLQSQENANTVKSSRFGYKGTDKKFKERSVLQLFKRVKSILKAADAKAKLESVNTTSVTGVTDKTKSVKKSKNKQKSKQ